jgi:hypothetical protein
MCLDPLVVHPIPEETEHVARAALPRGNLYTRLYDELGAIYSDPLFAPFLSTGFGGRISGLAFPPPRSVGRANKRVS